MLNNTNTYKKCENRFSIENIFKTIYCYIATSVRNLTAITFLYPQSHCIYLPHMITAPIYTALVIVPIQLLHLSTHIYIKLLRFCTKIAIAFLHHYIFLHFIRLCTHTHFYNHIGITFLHSNSYCISHTIAIVFCMVHSYSWCISSTT